jgi:hypothetical protein
MINCSIFDELGNNVSKFDVMCFVTIEANVELKKALYRLPSWVKFKV